MKKYTRHCTLAILTLGMAAAPLFAADTFQVDSLGESGRALTSGNSNVLDLVESVVKAQGAFKVYDGENYRSVLKYADFENAMRFDLNRNGTQAILDIPSIDFRRTFKGKNRDATYDSIEDFLKDEGSDVYRRFLESLNRHSKLAVNDGNPNATTAMAASDIFSDNAFDADDVSTGGSAAQEDAFTVGLLASAGFINTSDIDGDVYGLTIKMGKKFNDRFKMRVSIPLHYTSVEGADIYNVGAIFSFPYLVKPASRETIAAGGQGDFSKNPGKNPIMAASATTYGGPRGFEWQLTPSIGVLAGASEDFASGNLSGLLGLSSRLTYYTKHFAVTMGNQITAFEGFGLEIGGFDVGDDVSQQILKNGIQVNIPVGKRGAFEVYGIYTNFLEEAAVESYYTVGASYVFNLSTGGKSRLIRLGVYSDFDNDDYSSSGVRIGSAFQF